MGKRKRRKREKEKHRSSRLAGVSKNRGESERRTRRGKRKH